MNTPIPEKLRMALVDQFNHERNNAAIYKSVQAAFEEVNWHGFAAFCGKQSSGEQDHAEMFFKYLADRQAEISVDELPRPKTFGGEDIVENFEAVLALEVLTTSKINRLAQLSITEGDFLTLNALQWFLAEQVEEEATVVQLLSDLSHASGCDAAILMIDRELGK